MTGVSLFMRVVLFTDNLNTSIFERPIRFVRNLKATLEHNWLKSFKEILKNKKIIIKNPEIWSTHAAYKIWIKSVHGSYIWAVQHCTYDRNHSKNRFFKPKTDISAKKDFDFLIHHITFAVHYYEYVRE